MAFAQNVGWEYRILQQGSKHEILCSIHQARDCRNCCQHCDSKKTCPTACPNIMDVDPICFCKVIKHGPNYVYIYQLQENEICRNVQGKTQS